MMNISLIILLVSIVSVVFPISAFALTYDELQYKNRGYKALISSGGECTAESF